MTLDINANNVYYLDMTGITGATTITLANENNLPTEEIITDWGDGTQNSELTHTYSTAGEYVVVSNLQNGNTNNNMKGYLTKATIYYCTLPSGLFFTCAKLKEVNLTDNWVEKTIAKYGKNVSLSQVFYGCTNLETANTIQLTKFKPTYMVGTFYNCKKIKEIDLTGLDTSSVKEFRACFATCESISEVKGLENWDTSSAADMSSMFAFSFIPTLNLSSWDFSKVTTMFQFAKNSRITSIDLSNATFNNTRFTEFLYDNLYITTVNLSGAKISGNMESMFLSCSKLENINLTNAIIKPSSLKQTFGYCEKLTSLDTERIDVSSCKSMESTFKQCTSLTSLDLSSWDTSQCTSMSSVFSSCSSLTSLDLSSWDVSQCTTLQDMFLGCTSLITLNLANWNTSKVRMMSSVFYNCPKLKNLDITGWDTSSVGNMESMFFNNQAGMSLDLSSFNTQKVTAMNTIFQSCIFSSLDISNWTINDTTGVNNMFNNCKVSTIGLLYTSDATINKITSLLPTATKPLTIYYHDADASQLTPIEGVTFKKYQNPTTIQLPPHIQLHSLPDGTRDEVDIKTGILTRKTYRVKITGLNSDIKYTLRDVNVQGNITMQCDIKDAPKRRFLQSKTKTYCDFNVIPFIGTVSFTEAGEGNVGCGWYGATDRANTFCIRIPISYLEELTLESFKELLNKNPINIVYELETPTTEQLILNYNNSCDYGRILPTGMCDKYDVVNSMYTQTMTSILLDGENTWDAMEEFENTVKFTATGTTVGVEELNMLGAGGLYCDNDLFPNINDDSDVEHCRVDEAGNKFYIYISKDRLMSPDLIGWQIWLQANPFNLIYELAEHLTYVKPYEELDPTQARWEGMDCMRDGAIKYHANNSDNITMYPTLEYVAPSINNFEVTMLEPNTDYTIYAEGINANDTINLGGTDINFNNGTVYTSGDNQWLRIDNNDSFYNMVITKGDTTGEVVPYFEGMTSVENPKVQCGESTVSYTDLKLRSLPNGVKDTINVVTGEYVQRVGEVVLDGSEDEGWFRQHYITGYTTFRHYMKILATDTSYRIGNVNCNRFNTENYINLQAQEREFITIRNGDLGELLINIKNDKGNTAKLFSQWLAKNPVIVQYQLRKPITTKLDPQTLLAYADGTINLSSDTGLLPTTHYTVPSTNTFHLPSMKTGTRYTLKYPSASGSIIIGDITYKITSDSMLFTTPLKINGDTSAIIFSDTNPENVVLIEGVYNTREVPYFIGVKSVKNPNIVTIDQLSTESYTYSCATDIELRGLPNGVADKLDIVKGKLTTNVGIRPYQEGDENLPNTWTDGYETVYALSSPIVTNVEFETPYVTANSLIELSSDYLIPQLNYRAPSSNNFPLDLLQPNQTYTLYADTLASGSYTLGGTKTGVYSQPHTITLGDMTDNLLTFNGDLGLSNVMLVKGNSLKTTLPPYFLGIRSVTDGHLLVEGMAGEMNELAIDEGIVLRDCNGVKDTIDLITCTLTKRTGEITLTGAEGWFTIPNESVNAPDDYVVFALTLQGVDSSNKYDLICDTITSKYLYNKPHDTESIYGLNNSIRMCVKKSRIGGDTVNALKSWLNQNPTTVVYSLKTPLEVPLENVWTTTPPTSYNNQTEISSTVSTNSLKPMISVTIATTTLEEIVSDLEARNTQLEEENIATMLALTEVYELMYTPLATTTESQVATYGLRRSVEPIGMSVSPIGMVYARLVNKGLKSIDEVPYNLQVEVMYALRGME